MCWIASHDLEQSPKVKSLPFLPLVMQSVSGTQRSEYVFTTEEDF